MSVAAPRKHDSDGILDAAALTALRDGPRATSIAAIARESGAPVGTLYHRFGSRDGVVVAAWMRALERFQADCLAAAASKPDPLDAGVAMAIAMVAFARSHPADARLLLLVRPQDLLDADPGAALSARLEAMNAPLEAELRRVVRGPGARVDARGLEAVRRAVVDLPYAAVRRHGETEPMPSWLEADVGAATRSLLEARYAKP